MTAGTRRFLRRNWMLALLVALVAGLTAWTGELSARSRRNPAPDALVQGGQAERPGGQRGGSSRPSPPGFGEWWNDTAIKKELNLSDKVAGNIDRIYRVRDQQMRPFADDYEKELDRLGALTRERTATAEAYALQVSRVESLRVELNKSRLVMFYRMYLELTPDQYRKLQEIRDRRGRGGRGSGLPRTR